MQFWYRKCLHLYRSQVGGRVGEPAHPITLERACLRGVPFMLFRNEQYSGRPISFGFRLDLPCGLCANALSISSRSHFEFSSEFLVVASNFMIASIQAWMPVSKFTRSQLATKIEVLSQCTRCEFDVISERTKKRKRSLIFWKSISSDNDVNPKLTSR